MDSFSDNEDWEMIDSHSDQSVLEMDDDDGWGIPSREGHLDQASDVLDWTQRWGETPIEFQEWGDINLDSFPTLSTTDTLLMQPDFSDLFNSAVTPEQVPPKLNALTSLVTQDEPASSAANVPAWSIPAQKSHVTRPTIRAASTSIGASRRNSVVPKHTEATASDLFAPTSGFIQFPQHFDFNAARTPQAREPQTEAWTPISSSSTSLNVVKTLPAGAQVMSRRRQRSSPEPSIGAMVASATHCFQLAFPGQCQTVRPQKRVRSALGAVEKAKVRDVRKKKACLRCHLQKISCDGNTPCQQCLKVQGKTRFYQAVCLRLNLEEAISFRAGNSKFKQETAMVLPYPLWETNAQTIAVKLQRPAAHSMRWPKGSRRPLLEVTIRTYIPCRGEITSERWRSGTQEVILELPPVAAVDNQATTNALLAWVDDTFDYYAQDMTAQNGDFLISATFDEAIRFASKNPTSMVRTALKIWIGAKMAQEFFCLEEENSLGIAKVHDPFSIHNGQCPVPPVLDHQVDVLMIQEMLRMNANILREMKRVIESRNPDHWFEVFLTCFVLLCNLQYVHAAQTRYWKMHFNTGVGNAIGEAYRSISYKFNQRYEHSAKNIIAHFRFALKGPVPFTLDWDKESVKRMGNLDADAVKYVKYVSGIARRRAEEFKSTAEQTKQGIFEGDMFWASQLFINDDL